jgi:MoaA/NifB/PqqE/SkfB family radical SAM enzyme
MTVIDIKSRPVSFTPERRPAGFSEYLENPKIAARYRRLKRYFKIKESAYDVTSQCQLRCEGCYYFQGDKYQVDDEKAADRWKAFMEEEKARGINYVNLAGAEPAIVPGILRACYEIMPLGNIFTNGLRRIERDIQYRIHISVWGDSVGDRKYRGVYCLPKQLRNYRDDDRVIFVFTFNRHNIDEFDEVIDAIADAGHQITFNVYSDPVGHDSDLKVDECARKAIYEKMIWAMETYDGAVVYSYYNAEVHTASQSLDRQFGCPYPRASAKRGGHMGIGQTFRTYRADLSWEENTNCCVPDTDCADCRHYAAGSAIVSSRMNLHVDSEEKFRGWLDYVDTYLAVWIYGYEKGENYYRLA